jgi:hypothetical protein
MAGSQTESVMIRTEELFGFEQATTVSLVKRPTGQRRPVSRRRAAQ